MKNSILVTITTIRGSKQYTITQIIKKFLITILFFFIVLMIGSFFFIKYLNSVIDTKNNELQTSKIEIQRLTTQKENLDFKIITLEKNISSLENIIAKKEKILSEVNDKIADIERIIQFTPPKDIKINQRLDLAKLNLIDKKIMLRNIPNGYPVPYIGISSKFGWRKHPILHKKEFHTGLDLRAKLKTPIKATADGIVEYAGFHKRSGYGNLLIIDHNFGFKTLFAHLHKIVVKNGDFVKKGQIVGYTGNTGLSNGPHLHYEIRYIGVVLNPIHFIKWDLKNYNYIFKKEKKVKWEEVIKAINWQKNLILQK